METEQEIDRKTRREKRIRMRELKSVLGPAERFQMFSFEEALSSYLQTLESKGAPEEDIKKIYLQNAVRFSNSPFEGRMEQIGSLQNIVRDIKLSNNGTNGHRESEVFLKPNNEHPL
ncbi:MAG: hypothetical protein A3C27_01075 [Candidatus Levybacteria bacterium RIFCSPHIGHO2_02_FULL_39_36]|nr:MAG: hypothetical protein UT20_C0005G0013 [Candidatus Levybacteria bacterium GW2011_GWA1_39_11]KKR25089.1 MAG: hypothetical protein UT56_C0003G0013 [Candidatus Levybacteria bacterium GW2011_GWB1_39_7]OGH15538.1 MAG: hypothetical protein A2689_03095 [Candidatus Levybacteria bacterium RIFCSPHIGHO2_01_FULL_38_96]OGH25448.1 MAG: hypothetical protein A3E68_01070 [Candidatus Levybacteria bacterium RIFCSPHIGHO2_12_FULL_39_39]OGH28405.1 MAG: hypothetical protein A3C27_01075 [Candidatus Levybacteria 